MNRRTSQPLCMLRLSKYDPALRDASGAFVGDDWTHFAQLGRSFAGVELTQAEYERVEANSHRQAPVRDGQHLLRRDLPPVLRGLLREQFGCRLESDRAYVHVGWDFYVYVGLPQQPQAASVRARELGLFVEPFASPCRSERRPCDRRSSSGA